MGMPTVSAPATPTAAPRVRPAVRSRLVLSHALASVGMSLPWPLLLDGVWSSTGSESLLGLTGAARMAPYVLFSWWVAALADRFGRGRVVRQTLWLRTALLAGTAALLVGPGVPPWGYAVVLASAAVAAGTPAYPALMAAMPTVGSGSARRASGLLVTVEVASFVVGPAVGGLALGRLAPATVCLVGAGFCAAALLALRGIRLPAVVKADHAASAPETSSVVRVICRSARVRGAVAAICVVNFVNAALLVALVPIADDRWGSHTAYGTATAAFGFGALGAPLLAWIGHTAIGRVHLGMVVFGGALFALVPAAWPVAVLAALALAGGIAVHVEAAATELLQDGVPDRIRSAVLGVTDSAMVSAAAVGSLSGPLLVSLWGGTGLLVGLAVATAVAGFIALPTVVRGVTRSAVDPGSSAEPS